MARLWTRDGRLVVRNGRLMLCDECPCDSECVKRVKARAKALIDAGTHTLVGTYGGDYHCAAFEQDSEGNWTCTRRASGHLVLVLERPATIPSYIEWESPSSQCYMIYATTLLNTSTNTYLTIGCQCEVDWETYECNPTYQEKTGFCAVAVLVDVLSSPIESYELYEVCLPDICSARKAFIGAYSSWYGGTTGNEGVIMTAPATAGDVPTFTPVQKFWQYTNANGDAVYKALDCNCGLLYDWYDPEWTSEMTYIPISGICSSACQYTDILTAWASLNGWQVKGEGALFPLDQTGGSVYDYHQQGIYKAAVYVADYSAWYVVGCGCNAITKITASSADSYRYIEFSGACTCLDSREILIDYPDVFGVQDISWGSNTIVKVTLSSSVLYTHPTQFEAAAGTYSSEEVNGFLDSRTFAFIIQKSNGKYMWGYVSPSGSPVGTSTPTDEYDGVEFMGLWSPFTAHPYIENYNWTGPIIQWESSNPATWYGEDCFNNEADAQSYAASTVWGSVCGLRNYVGAFAAEVNEPLTEVITIQTGEYHYDSEKGQWCGKPTAKRYTMPAVYRMQWIDTNEGLITYGNRTPRASLLIKGMSPYATQYGWAVCCHWCCAYSDDTTITAQKIDSDMHWCHEDYELPEEE